MGGFEKRLEILYPLVLVRSVQRVNRALPRRFDRSMIRATSSSGDLVALQGPGENFEGRFKLLGNDLVCTEIEKVLCVPDMPCPREDMHARCKLAGPYG